MIGSGLIRDALMLIEAASEQVELMTPHPPGCTYILGRLAAAEDSLRSASRELDYIETTGPFRKLLDDERQARRESTL